MANLTRILTDFNCCRLKMTSIIQRLKITPKSHHQPRPMPPQSNSGLSLGLFRNYHQFNQSGPPRKSTDYSKLILEHQFTIKEDVLLYTNPNKKYFRFLNMFAVSQFIFWLYLSQFAFTTMKDIPVTEEVKNDTSLPWWNKLNFGSYKKAITIGSFILGWGTLAFAWMYTLRSVRYLVLKKGGENLLFITFTPLLGNRKMVVPLTHVSAKHSRAATKTQFPIKVKGKYIYYLLDMNGEFKNIELFDYSAGIKRNWTK